MQTFITHSTANALGPLSICQATAQVLDNARLGKQRLECQQIINALETGKGYIHHPATKMWTNHVPALAVYGFYMCNEWAQRGNNDSLAEWFGSKCHHLTKEIDWPWWFGDERMVACHRSKLLRKNAVHYAPRFVDPASSFIEKYELHALPYLWPNWLLPKEFSISAAEFKRGDYTMPDNWLVNKDRQVKFL